MAEWTKQYPVDFSPHGDTQGEAVQKQDNEIGELYDKINKVGRHRHGESGSELKTGEIIVKDDFRVSFESEGDKELYITILKESSANSNDGDVSSLGIKEVGPGIKILDFYSSRTGGYVQIAETVLHKKAYCLPCTTQNLRGNVQNANDRLPSEFNPECYRKDVKGYSSSPIYDLQRQEQVQIVHSIDLNVMPYSSPNSGIYRVRWFIKRNQNNTSSACQFFHWNGTNKTNQGFVFWNIRSSDNTKRLLHLVTIYTYMNYPADTKERYFAGSMLIDTRTQERLCLSDFASYNAASDYVANSLYGSRWINTSDTLDRIGGLFIYGLQEAHIWVRRLA